MRVFLWIILITLFIYARPLLSQGLFEDALSASSSQGESRDTSVKISGYGRSGIFIGKEQDREEEQIKSLYAEIALKFKANTSGMASLFTELRFRQEDYLRRSQDSWELREAYLDAFWGSMDIRIGRQIIVWGRADGINPTNNLTPVDMGVRSPDFDDRRRAAWALRSRWYFSSLSLEAVWLPVYEYSLFPTFPLENPITMGEPWQKKRTLESGSFAVKLDLEHENFGASISGFLGQAPFPGLDLISVDMIPAEITVAFHSCQMAILGADFAVIPAGLFGLRGEAALRYPLESGNPLWEPAPDIFLVSGFDKELGDWFFVLQYQGKYLLEAASADSSQLGAFDTLNLAEQMIFLEVFDKNTMLSQQNKTVNHGMLLSIKWKTPDETLQFELQANAWFSSGELMARQVLTWTFADAFNLALGGELFMGRDNSLAGTIDELMSAAFMEIRGSF